MLEKNRQSKGEERPNSKLTDCQVGEILESDKLHQVLAKHYGVVESIISGIKRGNLWKHIEGKRHTSDTRTDNKTGVVGVSLRGSGAYQVKVTIKGIHHYLGTFDNINEAKQALSDWKHTT